MDWLRKGTRSDFEAKWVERFAKGIPREKIERHVMSGEFRNYIWHVFSYELIDKGEFLQGDWAREAFCLADKEGAVDFLGDIDGGTQLELEPGMGLAWAGGQREFYVVSRDWTWTYVKTHEDDWFGPYFYKIDEGQDG